MADKKYNLRKAKGIMQYCKDEIERQETIIDDEEYNIAGDADIEYGLALGASSALVNLLAKLKKSNPLVKLD